MHSELSLAEYLHAGTHVVLHEHAAVAAPLIPICPETIAILERRVDVVAVIHHQAVTGPVKTVEEPELLACAAQAVARGHQDVFRKRHPDPRVEVPLQDSVI